MSDSASVPVAFASALDGWEPWASRSANPECGGDVNRARDIVAGYHLEESHWGR